MNNYKGLVNDYCTGKGIVLEYKNSSCMNGEHIEWRSECEFEGQKIKSSRSYKSKKEADQDVAKKIVDRISSNTLSNTSLNSDEFTEKIEFKITKYIVLIDIENIKPRLDKLSLNSCKLYFPMSSYCTVKEELYNKHGTILKVNSSANDAADHLMTFHAAKLSVNTSKDTIFVIVSRDKAISTLNVMLKEEGFKVVHFTSDKEFEEYFTK